MALYNRVKVWVSNEVLTASDLNTEFNNILNNAVSSQLIGYSASVPQMQTVADPGNVGTESLAASTADELTRLRFVLKRMSGQAQWYVPTVGTLSTGGIGTTSLAASAVTSTKIGDGQVTPPKLADLNRVVSSSSGAFSMNSATPASVIAQTITTSASNRPIKLRLVPDGDLTVGNEAILFMTGSGAKGYAYFKRGTDIIASFNLQLNGTVTAWMPGGFYHEDATAAANTSYTYALYVALTAGTAFHVNYVKLVVTEER